MAQPRKKKTPASVLEKVSLCAKIVLHVSNAHQNYYPLPSHYPYFKSAENNLHTN